MKLARLIGLLACLVAPRAVAAIAFDATAGHTGSSCGSSSSPISITVTMAAGETGVLLVLFDVTSAPTVSSVSGGGTWASAGSSAGTPAGGTMQIWTTAAGGSASASSISVSFTGTTSSACMGVQQYTGVGSIKTANFVHAVGGSTSIAAVGVSCAGGAGCWFVGAAGDINTIGFKSPYFLANRVATTDGVTDDLWTLDSTGATGSIAATRDGSSNAWGIVAVELDIPNATPQQSMMGTGQ